MTWPAPTPLTAPPTAPPTPGSPPKEPSELVRLLRSVTPATWVALLGGSLVLIASAIVTASNWETIGLVARALALAAACAGLGLAAPRVRMVAPTTATVIAHIASFLAAPAGMAGTSAFGFTWPACLLVGGLVAAGATQLAGRSWRSDTMNAGQVVALAIAATGLGAITHAPAGVIAVGAAVGLLIAGATRRAVGLAVIALVSPVLSGLAESGIGSGSLRRAGLIGDQLGWAGPLTGALAGVVLLVAGRRLGQQSVTVAAVLAPVLGVVTGFAAVDAPVYAWWCLPAMFVITAELGGCGRLFERCSVAICAVSACVSTFVPGTSPDGAAAVPAALTAAAAVLLVVRRRIAGGDDFAGLAAIATCTVAAIHALGAPSSITTVVALIATAGAAFLSRTLHPYAVYVPATMALTTVASYTGSDMTSRVVDLTALATLVAIVIAARVRIAGMQPLWGLVEVSTVTLLSTVGAAGITGGHFATAWLVAVAVVTTAIGVVERRFSEWSLGVVVVAAFLTTLQQSGNGVGSSFWIAWAAVAGGLAVLGAVRRSVVHAYGATCAGVVTAAIAMAGHGWSVDQILGATMLIAIVATGVACALGRRTPLDAAAFTAGAAAALLSMFAAHDMLVSVAWLTIGLQIAVYGVALADRRVQIGGAVVALLAAISGWFTSGANAWALGVLDKIDVHPSDLWLFATTAIGGFAGTVLHRRFGVNAWIAYAGMFVIGEGWLGSVQANRETAWAIPAAITFAMVATCVGAWRKVPAMIAGGIGVTATTLVLASGQDLRELPTWVWLAAGGLVLLAIAVVIERRGVGGEA